MKTVLYITDLHVGSHVAQLSGVFDRARIHHWRVIEVETDRTNRSLPEILALWRPAGCIMECGKYVGEDVHSIFGSTPVVYIDPNPETSKLAKHTVSNDPEKVAKLAMRELLMTGPASFAFFSWYEPSVIWSRGRCRAFADRVKDHTGKTVATFDEPWDIGDPESAHVKMAEFLAALPKPVGIFSVNDYTTTQVLVACECAGLVAPRDFALVSVDNEEMRCENAIPTITSIEQDFRGAGHLAADLLAELLAKPKLGPRHLTFGPTRLVRRQSSRVLKLVDPRISGAVERIRRDATTGISATDILREIPLSRRLAEKRFLKATGRTILQEIQEVRYQEVLKLLTTDIPIGHIAARCGIQSDSYLKRHFKKRTGMTMREWRQTHMP